MLNPICVSQPCSLTERKKGRVGSVVMPYILSSTLRRMSTVSTLSNASSGLSSGSASSDGPPSQESVPLHRLLSFQTLQSVFVSFSLTSSVSRPSDRRASVLSRSEEDNRIARKNRKEWSVSKSQVLLERQSDADEVRHGPADPNVIRLDFVTSQRDGLT